MSGGVSKDDTNPESMEELRKHLNDMKRAFAERTAELQNNKASTQEIFSTKRQVATGIIDGNFLSFAFGTALFVIVSASVYAFYSLYNAILKKFPSRHEEL